MAAFKKPLSTHVYFHMESRKHQAAGSAFGQEGSGLSGDHRKKTWNQVSTSPDADRPGRSHGSHDLEHGHPPSLDSRTSIMVRDDSRTDLSDPVYFSHGPFMMSPEMPPRTRSKRRLVSRSPSVSYERILDHFRTDSVYGRPFEGHGSSEGSERHRRSPSFHGSRRSEVNSTRSMSLRRSLEPQTQRVARQECFIVPSQVTERFISLPLPLTVPEAKRIDGRMEDLEAECFEFVSPHHEDSNALSAEGINMMETAESKVCIIIDFRENASFASQDLPFPSTSLTLTPKEWLLTQLTKQRMAFDWVRDSGAAFEGLLLMNVERYSQFPFVTYLILNTGHTDPQRLIVQLKSYSAASQNTEHLHHTAGYEEVATIARPSLDMISKRPVTDKTGYIISAFRVFPGEDRERLERNWLTWTGARQIYKCLPQHLGLRRLTFHKKIFPEGGITYVLVCECIALVDHVTEALVFVDHLRARCCGYTALYRVVDIF